MHSKRSLLVEKQTRESKTKWFILQHRCQKRMNQWHSKQLKWSQWHKHIILTIWLTNTWTGILHNQYALPVVWVAKQYFNCKQKLYFKTPDKKFYRMNIYIIQWHGPWSNMHFSVSKLVWESRLCSKKQLLGKIWWQCKGSFWRHIWTYLPPCAFPSVWNQPPVGHLYILGAPEYANSGLQVESTTYRS